MSDRVRHSTLNYWPPGNRKLLTRDRYVSLYPLPAIEAWRRLTLTLVDTKKRRLKQTEVVKFIKKKFHSLSCINTQSNTLTITDPRRERDKYRSSSLDSSKSKTRPNFGLNFTRQSLITRGESASPATQLETHTHTYTRQATEEGGSVGVDRG